MGTGHAQASAALMQKQDVEAAQATFVMPTSDGMEVTVILSDGTTTKAILQMLETLASS